MKRFLALMLAGLLLLGLAACGGKVTGPEDFLARLESGGFLSGDIIERLPACRTMTDQNEQPYWHWGEDYGEHHLSAKANNGILAWYHYRAYGIQFEDAFNQTLTQKEELALVNRFIAAFRPDLNGLVWEKKTMQKSLTEDREAWIANDGKEDCGVLVWDGEVVGFSYGNQLGSIRPVPKPCQPRQDVL